MRLRITGALAALLGVVWALTGGASEPPAGPARFEASYTWQFGHDEFGGLSGIEVDPEGGSFVALSDRGRIFSGRIVREGNQITRISDVQTVPLRDDKGNYPPRFYPDPEGFARHPSNGRYFVSFEGFTRIWHYDPAFSIARWVREMPNFRDFAPNGGLESLAIDQRGRIYAIPEEIPDGQPGHPVYRLTGKKWEMPFRLPERGAFLPVEADFGPDGWLYLLEREFSSLRFRSRVRRFLIDGDRIVTEEPVFESGPAVHDNLEGLSVWRDGQGRIRLTMVSDDNFKFFQRTEIVEYSLP
ncbi:hypothetical protein SAMN05421688_2083 [Poseidonocella pacifica]|uniref:Phytase-like domain-containing protein n=1 Tax=Poseidonocella pacifica TaxID=871651 RepID=A0A1I0XCW3_9RHOB|nr:esterase-like activity of phytase family protein [Poseidonocella pacifica]SFA98266.1 hypothetical protein SAMN05421688_2083 [Poseidonocella pacifica]